MGTVLYIALFQLCSLYVRKEGRRTAICL